MGGVFSTVNLHLYHYAGNNPVKYTDPDGRAIPAVIAVAGAALAAGMLSHSTKELLSPESRQSFSEAVKAAWNKIGELGEKMIAASDALKAAIADNVIDIVNEVEKNVDAVRRSISDAVFKIKAKDRRTKEQEKNNEDKHGDSTWEEPASAGFVNWKAREKEKAEGKDARRESHDLKLRGEPDRSKGQINEDY